MSQTTHQSERDDRLRKSNQLRELGVNPYPAKSQRTHQIAKFLESFADLLAAEQVVCFTGRLRSLRVHGNICFADIEDFSGRLQAVFSKNEVGADDYKHFVKLADNSDFVELHGVAFVTKAGEKSLMVKSWKLLTKALRSIPNEHFGLEDADEKLRKRYLDIILNPELKDMIIKRDKFWNAIRAFLKSHNFIEVETPALENTAGGADARPFITHHNALDIDVFLRISMGELWQKKLMVAGLERTFEIGRQFRNEGMDAEHLQDYTQMEFYMSYADYEDGMKLVEEMYKYVAQETFGTLKFKIGKFDVDLGTDWIRYDYRETVLKYTGIDILTSDQATMEAKLKELNIDYDQAGFNLTRAIDNLWKYCRKQIGGPGFLVNVPVAVSPLAKRDDHNPAITQRFQPIIAGSELGNGYSELNDPVDQLERFNEQARLREAGDDEAQMKDEEFVEALEYGMPPTCGFGLSERVFSFLMNKTARECQIFPLMRPKGQIKESKTEGKVTDDSGKLTASTRPALNSEDLAEVQTDIADLPTIPDSRIGLNHAEAKALLQKYISDQTILNHSLETEAIMRALAERLGENEEEWGIIGLLHDIDWQLTKNDPANHCVKAVNILREAGAGQYLINSVISHCYGNEICGTYSTLRRSSRVEHALAAAETLTGLITASALIRPDKSLAGLELSSLKKKYNNQAFASNCNRQIIAEGEAVGLDLDEFLAIGLEALKKIAEKIGL